LKDFLEKRKAAEEGKGGTTLENKPFDANKMMRDAKQSMPKMPSANFKLPK